jgi:RNA polymerase sigma factor (sigma-70 family)
MVSSQAAGTGPAEPGLLELVERTRRGDAAAAAEMVRRYEPDIRRIARVRLARFGLRHLIDSEDIAQSVFGRFFTRLQAGGFEFESPEKVLHLLVVIATNRVNTHARRERNAARPTGTVGTEGPTMDAVPANLPAVGAGVAAGEEMEWLLGRLPAEERHLARQRMAGKAWAELEAELGVKAEALRKRLARALAEVGGQLGLSEPG